MTGRRSTFIVRFVALAAVLALALGACGGGGSTKSSNGGGSSAKCPVDALKNAKGPVDIRFWHIQQRANLDELVRQVDEFNASQKKVHVTLVAQTGYKELFEKFKAGLTSGDLPDVGQFEETTVQQLIDSRSTLPIQACVDADHYSLSDFLPRAISYYTVDDELQAMPWTVSNPILLFDRNKFVKAGLDPNKPPTTFDEVKAYSEKIVSSGAAKHGIALRTQDWFNEFFYAKSGQPYVNHDGGRDGRATKAELDNATGKKIWTWWKDMVGSGLAMNTGSADSNFDHLLAVATGDAAMTIDASGVLGPVEAALAGGGYGPVDIQGGPLPSLNGKGGVPVGDASLWISAKSSPVKQAAAWQFVKFLMEPKQIAGFVTASGYVPVRKSAAESAAVQDYYAKKPVYEVAYTQLLQPGGPAANGSVIGNYQGVRDAVRDALTEMLTKGASVDSALRQAQKNADAAIADYNERIGAG
jgi:sn-glycerol 3-phosphate transport system substrate-binding protein